MTNRDIVEIVRRIRQKNGWSQERLAHEIGVSFTTISNWERGKRTSQPYLWKFNEERFTHQP